MTILRCPLSAIIIFLLAFAKAEGLSISDSKDEISTQIKTDSYLIGTGEIDLERLTILNELYNPSSLDFMKIEPGMKILTLGCGIGLLEIEMAKQVGMQGEVLATDISPLQLSIAVKNREKASAPNLVFKELDLAHLNSISERFDRIHCRFVLSHMPWESIEKLLPLLMSKLTPSGALVIEEVTTVDSLTCEPFSEEYELWKTYVNKQFAVQGSDHSPGKHLYEYLKEQGYNFEYQTHQPILKERREKQVLSLGIRSIAQGLIDKKMAFLKEIFEAIESLKKLEEDPRVLPRYSEISQFFIKLSDQISPPTFSKDPAKERKLIDQFFNYIEFLGNLENKITLDSLQSFVTSDFTVQSNNTILSQGIYGFADYINRMQEKYEKMHYSELLEEPIIFADKASFHFQVDCVEKNGDQRKLDVMATLSFKEEKISCWREVFCDVSESLESDLQYVHQILQPKDEVRDTKISLRHSYEEPCFNYEPFLVQSPLTEGYLSVSEIHTIFYATYGNPKGIPIVILHGGPGEGSCDAITRFFDLNRYYVIMFDQRGSKRSKPFALMEKNTPADSVKDIESLRKHLGIEKWLVYGGSWGSALAILYGQSHPEHCEGFILRGIFLGREEDYLHLFYGMGELSPKAYERFLNYVPVEERYDLFSAYYQRIMHPDPKIHMPAARAFIEFDATCVHFFPNVDAVKNALKSDESVYCVSKHFFHYSKNKFFLEPNQILSNIDKIKHLPAIIIHGKCDIVTLPENAYTLYRTWDNSTLWMIPQGGHTSMEPAIGSAITTALGFFADRILNTD